MRRVCPLGPHHPRIAATVAGEGSDPATIAAASDALGQVSPRGSMPAGPAVQPAQRVAGSTRPLVVGGRRRRRCYGSHAGSDDEGKRIRNHGVASEILTKFPDTERHSSGFVPGVRIFHTVRCVATLGAVIARNVRKERAGLQWDQGQLAAAIGWSRTTVSNLENGKRIVTADDIPVLCRALGVTFAQLVDRADPDDMTALGL